MCSPECRVVYSRAEGLMNQSSVNISYQDKIAISKAKSIQAVVAGLASVQFAIAYPQNSGIGSIKALINIDGIIPHSTFQQIKQILAGSVG